jgi:chromosome segregation ATPase
VRDRVRAEADLESAVDRLIALYERALVRAAGPGDGHRAAAEHLRLVMRPLKEASALRLRAEQLERELTLARHERDTVTQERTSLHDRIATLEANERALHDAAAHDRHEAGRRASALEGREQAAHVAAERLARELAEARQRCARLERMLAEYQGLTALRLRDAVLRLPLAGSAAHGVARLMFPSRKTP